MKYAILALEETVLQNLRKKEKIMANKKMVIGGSSLTASQMKDFFRQVEEGSVTSCMFQAFLERRNPFEKTGDVLGEWREFYRKYFGIELGDIKIPEKTPEQGEFSRLIIVAKDLTNNQVYNTCTKHFPCWRHTDNLDKDVPTNERDPKNGSYAIWVRDVVEADEVHKRKSAEMIKKENLTTETLLERMLHELKHFSETGKHLDISNWTLCSGSRFRGGSVPSAGWDGSRFEVGWNYAGNRDENLRSREVIS